ncbi:MAG: hypothetical protein WA964_07915 [Ilumatobacter sp.]|uniref:SCO7613 C-terminal domain-containing membrane protein n=1 Tax=Ilumatobacter sp. TaxID=1967498 RepID=UPI003C76FD48
MTDTRPAHPPPTPGSSAAPGPPTPSPGADTQPGLRLSGPGWLAATGATLLLVAAVVVVAGQWSTIGPTARFAGLVGALFAVYFAAESSRVRIPTTATSLAVLAACVTAPVGIAAVAALDGRWPTCIMIGGGAALVACELQSRRWQVRTLKAATVAATLLFLAGLSVLVDVPVAILGAVASACALAVGARRRSDALAVLVPLVPALWILAELGVGPGVLARMGVVDVEAWVIPVSTLIAGCTLAVSAHRSLRADVAATSLVVLAFSGVSALIETVAPASVWLSVPGAVATVIAVAALGTDRSIFSRWACQARSVAATTLAATLWIAPIGIVLIRVVDDVTRAALGGQLLLPAAVSLAALLLLIATSERSTALDDITRFGCVAGLVSVVAATDVAIVWVAVAALATWAITTAATSWRTWIATSSVHATWAVVAMLASQSTPVVSSGVIVLAAALVVIACLSSNNTSAVAIGIPVPIVFGTALLALQWPDRFAALAAVLAITAITATGLAMSRPGFTPADSMALSLGSCAATVALFSDASGVSLGLTLLAGQVWIYGVAFRRADIATIAACLGLVSLSSLWWTTGTNDFVIDWIAPHGADGQDLALGAAALSLIGGGAALRRVQRLSTWLAYSPGLSLAFAWLLMAQSDVDAAWATLAGLVLGVCSVGIGGVRRLAAPLAIGTVGLAATGVISIGDRLASAPTWTWIAVGGAGLLAVAALLERSERPLLPVRPAAPGQGVESLTEAFARAFE